MNKKFLVWLMLLTMVVSAVAAGFAAPYDAIVFDEDYIKEVILKDKGEDNEEDIDTYRSVTDVLYDKGLVYILLSRHIYVYDIKAEKTTLLKEFLSGDKLNLWFNNFEDAEKALGDEAEMLINYLFTWEDKLYGINKLTGKAIPINQETGDFLMDEAIELPWKDEYNPDEEEDNYGETIFQGAFYGKLYFITRTYTNKGYPLNAAFSIDLTTKEMIKYDNPYAQRIMAYKDQGLVITAFDEEKFINEDTGETNPLQVRAFPTGDLNGEGTLLAELKYDTRDIAYSEKEDALYYTYSGKVYKLAPGQEPQQVGYSLNTYGDNKQKAWITDESLYITWGSWSSGVIIKNLDPQYMPKASLVINGGGYNDKANKAFAEKYPDVPIVALSWEEERVENEQALTQAIQSGETNTDIYFVSPGYFDFKNVMKKEYALPLNGNKGISDSVARMYPFIQQAITHNGQIYAVPEDATVFSNFSLVTESWENAGLTDSDIPKTYMDVLKMAKQWFDGLNEEYPEFAFFGGQDYLTQSDFIYMMIDEYINYYQHKQELLDFDTPLFRKIMETIQQINIPVKPAEESDGGMAIMGMDSEYKEGLFQRGGSSLLEGGSDRYSKGLYLPLDEGLEVANAVHTRVAFVNPRSQNQDLAFAYLEEILNNYTPSQQTGLYEDVNEPVKSEYYEERVKDMEKYLKEYENQLETAEGEEKKNIEQTIKMMKEELEHKDEWYWAISQKSLDQFNALVPSFFVKESEVLYSGDSEGNVYALLQNYIDGAISLDQFISEANRRVQMAALESQ